MLTESERYLKELEAKFFDSLDDIKDLTGQIDALRFRFSRAIRDGERFVVLLFDDIATRISTLGSVNAQSMASFELWQEAKRKPPEPPDARTDAEKIDEANGVQDVPAPVISRPPDQPF